MVNCFAIINMIINCSLSNVMTDFYKGYPAVGISTGFFLLDSLNFIKVKKKQIIVHIIIIA